MVILASDGATTQPGEPLFAPGVNIGLASSGRSPQTCALAVSWGSWSCPDDAFAEAVMIQTTPPQLPMAIADFEEA